jgi:hypothetical protein
VKRLRRRVPHVTAGDSATRKNSALRRPPAVSTDVADEPPTRRLISKPAPDPTNEVLTPDQLPQSRGVAGRAGDESMAGRGVAHHESVRPPFSRWRCGTAETACSWCVSTANRADSWLVAAIDAADHVAMVWYVLGTFGLRVEA